MGNKKKADKRLPADHLRIKAFARSLAPIWSKTHPDQELKVIAIQESLSQLARPIHIPAQTLTSWLTGEKWPTVTYAKLLNYGLPGCASWLEHDIDSSPMSRFICALDMWGSPIDSPVRRLDTSTSFTVGRGLASLAKRWASAARFSRGNVFSGCTIPRLNCPVPRQVPSTVYQASNCLTLMDFMFRCGAYLEMSDEEFAEWAIDLASLTLMIGAFLDGITAPERYQSATTGDYYSLANLILFRTTDIWPKLETVRIQLGKFPEFNDSVIDYPQRLMLAREVLKEKLWSIGSDLSIAKELANKVIDRNRGMPEFQDASSGTFFKSDLPRVKRNISPAASGRYQYLLRNGSSVKKIVLVQDLENGTEAPLLERPDLYFGYPGTFSWGYSGDGPIFLTISILAHHFGHANFGKEEIDRLHDAYISMLPYHHVGMCYALTTEVIEKCLNE